METTFSTSDPLTKKLWDEELFRETLQESYFPKFFGKTRDSIVYEKTKLTKEKGDKITFGIRYELEGDGVEDNETLEGNEEGLDTADYSLTLKRYRHAVKDDGELSRQRAMFSIDDESTTALKNWGARKIDKLCFDAILDTPSLVAYKTGASTFLTNATAATAKAALDATNSKLTMNFISYLKTIAKTGKGNTFIPLRPVMHQGQPYYILLVHPDVLFDLKTESAFQQAQREAQARGKENPIFIGATAIVDGVIIHEHVNCTIASDGGGGSVPWAKCVFMGCQALCYAWGRRPEVVEKEFDYGEKHGYAWGMTARAGKPVFDAVDYGSFGVYLSRTAVSG